MAIEELVAQLSNDPFNPDLNFKCAVEYERINQTASAVSFYLRAAEYGVGINKDVVYASLLRMAHCFEDQNDRIRTVNNCYLQALAFNPKRPEAYFLISQKCGREGIWQDAYTWASLGLASDLDSDPLPAHIGYHGTYCLEFQKAISGWWIGQAKEAEEMLKSLHLRIDNLSPEYRVAVMNNLKNLGITQTQNVLPLDPLEPVVMNYRKFFGATAPVIVDIGTRDGDDANYLCKGLNGTKVIAIDANPEGADLTRSNYPWMDVKHAAIGDVNGEITFHKVSSDNKELVGCSSIFSKETSMYPQDFANNTTAITVPITRMDTVLEGTPGLIDVVKVDTEGFTWQVLQGFGDRLKDVKVFHLETERVKVNETHVTLEAVTDFMKEHGFYLADISYEWGWGIQDQVWVNKDLAIKCREVFNDI